MTVSSALDPVFLSRLEVAVRSVLAHDPSSGWVEVWGSPGMVHALREALPQDLSGRRSLGGVPVLFRREPGSVSAEMVRLSLPEPAAAPLRLVAEVRGLSDAVHDVFVQFRADGMSYDSALSAARAVLS